MKIISCRSLAALLAVVLLGTTSLQAETPAAGKGETPAERGAHEVVARGPLRHVHPLGRLLRARRHLPRQADRRHRRMDHEPRQDSRGRVCRLRQAVQPREVRRRPVGQHRQGCGHEVHRHHRRSITTASPCSTPRPAPTTSTTPRPSIAIRWRNWPRPAASKASSWASIIRRPRTGTIRAATPPAATGTRPRTATWTKYIEEIAVPQVQEILSNYGDVPGRALVGHARQHDSQRRCGEAATRWLKQLQAGHHHEQPAGRRLPRRYGNARAVHPGHRLRGPRLGNLHDDERHLGLQVATTTTGSAPRR